MYGAFNTLSEFLHNSTQAISPIEIVVGIRNLPATDISAIVREEIAKHMLPIPDKNYPHNGYQRDGHSHNGHHNNFGNNPFYLPVAHYTPHGSIKPNNNRHYRGIDRNYIPKKWGNKHRTITIININPDYKRSGRKKITKQQLPYIKPPKMR